MLNWTIIVRVYFKKFKEFLANVDTAIYYSFNLSKLVHESRSSSMMLTTLIDIVLAKNVVFEYYNQ